MLAALLAFLWWSDQPRFRHGFVADIQACSVLQLAQLPASADFVAIGSSRLLMGLSPEVLETASGGHIRNAYNLGRVRRSIERSYRIFSDVIDAGIRPRYVFVEVSQDRLSGRGQGRMPVPRDAAFMRYSDALMYVRAMPGSPLLERWHFVIGHVLRKLDTSIKYLFSLASWKHLMAEDVQAPKVCHGDAAFLQAPGHERAIAHQRKIYQRQFGNLDVALDDTFRWGTTRRAEVELYFLDRIRELAGRHGVKLLVGMHWRAFQPPLSPRAVEDVRAVVPEFVYPPEELVRASWGGFVDKGHMDKPARDLYSEWLGGLLGSQEALDGQPYRRNGRQGADNTLHSGGKS